MSRDAIVYNVFIGFGLGLMTGTIQVSICYWGGFLLFLMAAWAGKVVWNGRSRWYRTARRLLWSIGLAPIPAFKSVSFILTLTDDLAPIGLLACFFWLIAAFTPVIFALLLLLAIPLHVLKWAFKQVKAYQERKRNEQYKREQHQTYLRQVEKSRMQEKCESLRTEARAQCELLYGLYGAEIKDRFSKSMLDQFMNTYMNSQQDVSDVQRRGKELCKIIEQHKSMAKPEKQPRSIAQLSHWYLEEKSRIDALPLDARMKKGHLVQLDIRYAELTQELLEKMEP